MELLNWVWENGEMVAIFIVILIFLANVSKYVFQLVLVISILIIAFFIMNSLGIPIIDEFFGPMSKKIIGGETGL